MNRDPVVERGGINIYGLVGNGQLNDSDALGLMSSCGGMWPHHCNPNTPWVPEPTETWTCESATDFLRAKIEEWRKDPELQYKYAADILEAYLDQDADLIDPEDHIKEIKKEGGPLICSTIGAAVCASSSSSSFYVNIKPKDENDSNIRWWIGISNPHMFNAIGGGRLTATGMAYKERGGAWKGTFQINIRDKYEFIKDDSRGDGAKQWISELFARSYRAAVYLEEHCGIKPIDHEVSFSLDCRGCCPTIWAHPGAM